MRLATFGMMLGIFCRDDVRAGIRSKAFR